MQSHWFYAGVFVLFLTAIAFFAPSNFITGLSVSSCDGCGLLCEDDNECSTGLSCCETAWELGVCHYGSACPSVKELSVMSTAEEFQNPQRPRAINNIAWQTFGLPLLVVVATVIIAVVVTRRTGREE